MVLIDVVRGRSLWAAVLHRIMVATRSHDMPLNEAAYTLVQPLLDQPGLFGTSCHRLAGAVVVDCGVDAAGGAEAGLVIARAALGGLGDVRLVEGRTEKDIAFEDGWPDVPWPAVTVHSRSPVAACLASQYAGWKVATPDYFAMASGPIRAAIGREDLFDHVNHREHAAVAVGILESSSLPPEDVCRKLAADAGVTPDRLVLLVARTASVAGGLQVVARSLETALHKLHDLAFDLSRVVAGRGVAPMPPIPPKDLTAIGRTNDAILYGGIVVLEVRGDDESLSAVGPRCVSASSAAYGEPFLALFERAGRDFYKLDPALFAPAVVEFVNVDTGRRQRFGALAPDIVGRSFADRSAG
jgi:methenyltetrahydromethanopterin cyclohydrolase